MLEDEVVIIPNISHHLDAGIIPEEELIQDVPDSPPDFKHDSHPDPHQNPSLRSQYLIIKDIIN